MVGRSGGPHHADESDARWAHAARACGTGTAGVLGGSSAILAAASGHRPPAYAWPLHVSNLYFKLL